MRLRVLAFVPAIATLMLAGSATALADWPTYHLDNTRAGYDSSQPGMSGATAGWSSGSFGTLMASPIVVGITVYEASESNHVIAFDTATGTVKWDRLVGTPATSGFGCGQSFGGITSTPVADVPANTLYVSGLINVSGTVNYWLTSLNLTSGAINWQKKLNPSGLNWVYQGQRGALALANGYVYIPFGGRDGDCGSYHGWVIGISTGNAAMITFETDTAVNGTPFWATGGLAVDSTTGDLLGATGNSGCPSQPHQTQSLLRLSPTLQLLDTFTEPDWSRNSCGDLDLGSVTPLVLSGGYAFIVGKQSIGYILRINALGGIGGQAFPPGNNLAAGDVCGGGMAFGASAYAAPYIFVPCDNGLVALNFNPSGPSFTKAWNSNFWATPPIVAAGTVWTTDTNGSGLWGLDPASGSVRFHSASFGINHFATVAESGNTIFVPGSSQLLTFRIGSCPTSPAYTGYFNWYDNASAGMIQDNIHVLNPGASAVAGCVMLPGSALGFNLAAGQEGYFHFGAGTIGGPVMVMATARVIASQRVQYYQSFNEVPASTSADAAMTSYFNWYDDASPGMLQDNIHLLNPGASAASGTITVAGYPVKSFNVGAGGEAYYNFPQGTIGGPVTVSVTSGPAIIASQRVTYYQSFNEIRGKSAAAAASTAYFNWYDHASPGMMQDNIHLVNPGGTAAAGSISLSGGASVPFNVGPGAEQYYNFPQGTIGGPVTVSVTSGPAVIASQRVSYYQSFNEVSAATAADAASTAYFNWYDHASPGMYQDNIHLLNPSGTASSGTISIAGRPSVAFAVGPGAEQYYNFPQGTIGGPVTVSVTSGSAVISAQRVTFYQSFNEVAGAQ